MSKGDREATIKDVAEKAGVAISTVSRVLNNLDRVSDETRDKVKKAAKDIGFVKNDIAASMKTGQTKLIAVVAVSYTHLRTEDRLKNGARRRHFDAHYVAAVTLRHRHTGKRGVQICGFSPEGGSDVLADFTDRSHGVCGFSVSVLFLSLIHI